MSYRWSVATAVAVLMLVPGCSSDKPSVSTPTASKSASSTAESTESTESSGASESSEADAPSAPLDADACVEVTGASLDLSAATSKDDARTAADTLEKYDPPPSAKEAIEHFAETGGVQIDDKDLDKYNGILDKWTKEVCP